MATGDWRNPASSTGPGLDDYINQEILAGRIVDQNGAVIGASTFQVPVWPGNPLFMLEAWDLDGFGNTAPSAPRPLFVTAADAIVAASHTWTFANGTFTVRDIGGTLTVNGATNAANNGVFIITAVTGPTTIVTTGVQVNETFATVANFTVVVTDTSISDGCVVYGAVNKGAQTNAGAATSWVKGGGNLYYKARAANGRVGNLPSIRTDGTGWMQTTPAVTALAQPVTIAMVYSIDSVAAGSIGSLFDGLGASRAWINVTAATGVLNMGSGAGAVATTVAMNSSQYQTLIAVYNGASSFLRLNGVQSANVNPTIGGGLTGMTAFALITGIQQMVAGDIVCLGCWTDGTSPALIESAIASIAGGNPS